MDILRFQMFDEVMEIIRDCNRLKYFSVSTDAELSIIQHSVGLLLSNSSEYPAIKLSSVFRDKYLYLIINLVSKYKGLGLLPMSHQGSKIYSWLMSSDYNNMFVLRKSNKQRQCFLGTVTRNIKPGYKFSVSQLFDSLLEISKKRSLVLSHPKKVIWSDKRIGQKNNGKSLEYIVNDKSLYESWGVLASIISIKNNMESSLLFARKYNLPHLSALLISLDKIKISYLEPSINRVVSEEVNRCLFLMDNISEALDDIFVCLYKRRMGGMVKGVFVINTGSGVGRELRVDGHSVFVPYDDYRGYGAALSYSETFVSIFKADNFNDLVDLLVCHFRDIGYMDVA